MSQSTADKDFRTVVQEKYEELVRNQGELFERLTVPMNESDRAALKKKQRVVVFVLAPVLLCVLSITLYFVWDGSLLSYLFLVFIGVIILAAVIVHLYYVRALHENTKETFKGVITNKQKIDDGDNVDYDFELSYKETISVSRSTYKEFQIGDIIEIERVGGQGSLGLNTKTKRIGTIF